jgi:hypothetical protein
MEQERQKVLDNIFKQFMVHRLIKPIMDRPTEIVDVESSESDEDRLVIVDDEERQPKRIPSIQQHT